MFGFLRSFGKRKIAMLFIVLLAVIALAGGIYVNRLRLFSRAEVLKENKLEPEFISNEIVIKLNDTNFKSVNRDKKILNSQDTGIKRLNNLNKVFGANKVERIFDNQDPDLSRWYKITFDGEKKTLKGNITKTKSTLSKSKDVTIGDLIKVYKALGLDNVEPNYVVRSNMIPNDTYYSTKNIDATLYDLWGLHKIGAEQAWDKTQGEGVVVAVVDTGVDYNYPDLASNIFKDESGKVIGYDFANNDNDPMDDVGHGTHVAGTIAAVGNNDSDHSVNSGTRLVGVSWKAKIMPVKSLGADGGTDDWCAAAIVFAVDHGAKIINGSWGGLGQSQLINNAIDYSYGKGRVNIFAAGNDDMAVDLFSPAGLEKVITVGASNDLDTKASFSNYGARVDFLAPGGERIVKDYVVQREVNILSAKSSTLYYQFKSFVYDSYYLKLLGTSMAAPHASGAAALILAAHPDYTNEEVRFALKGTAESLAWDMEKGSGRINANNAINLSTPPAVVSLNVPKNAYYGTTQNISGSISSRSGIKNWTLAYSKDDNLTTWTQIASGSSAKSGVLGVLPNLSYGNYVVRLECINGSDLKSQIYAEIFFDSQIVAGFPKEIYPASSALGDVNADGQDEIIMSESLTGRINVLNANGNPLPGFPFDPGLWTDTEWGDSGVPVIDDVNNDGRAEIIFATVSSSFTEGGYKSKIWIIDGTARTLPGWPISVTNARGDEWIGSEPTIFDVNSDGKKEIAIKTEDGDAVIYDSNGKILPGWPVTMFINLNLASQIPMQVPPVPGSGPVLVSDINNDKKAEVIVGMSNNLWKEDTPKIFVYSSDGKLMTGWPQSFSDPNRLYNTPKIGLADINGDGKKEISGKFYPTIVTWDYLGKTLWGWRRSDPVFAGDGPKFGDFSASLGYETVYPNCNQLQVYDKDGKQLAGFPWTFYEGDTPPESADEACEVGLIDINNDSLAEFVIPQLSEGLKGYNLARKMIFNKKTKGYPIGSSIVTGDTDKDGKLELVTTSSFGLGSFYGFLYVWNLDTPATKYTKWQQFHRNAAHDATFVSYFLDVNSSNSFYDYIMTLSENLLVASKNCSSSYPAGSKCYFPDNNTTRGEAAAFIARAKRLPIYTGSEQPFRDVSTTNPYYQEIMACYKAGIINGYGDGTYRPNDTMNRAQVAVIIQRAKNIPFYSSPQTFIDVPTTYWAFKEIDAINRAGIDKGCSGQYSRELRFCPETPVTRKEMAKWIYNAFLK